MMGGRRLLVPTTTGRWEWREMQRAGKWQQSISKIPATNTAPSTGARSTQTRGDALLIRLEVGDVATAGDYSGGEGVVFRD